MPESQPDLFRSPALLVLKASAGSGKTYALVRHYLRLCFSGRSPSYYRHILAITFTNAAAAEMKERVINRLHEIATSPHETLSKMPLAMELAAELGIELHELQARAVRILSHMVHHYDLLAITTIDSFTHRIVRSFARELGMDYDFSVELDTSAFLSTLVDRVMECAGEDADLTRYLTGFVAARMEEGKNWRIQNELLDFARVLVEEKSIDPLSRLERTDSSEFQHAVRSILDRKEQMTEELRRQAGVLLDMLQGAGLQSEDFSGGTSRSPIRNIIQWSQGEWKEAGKSLLDVITGQKPWFAARSSAHIRQAFDAIQPDFSQGLDHLMKWMERHLVIRMQLDLLQRNLFSLGLITVLNRMAAEIRQEDNLLLIADFQRRINEVIEGSPAPFIYERIGERFRHVLFDEFQDTSELQWRNFIPLIENNLASANFNLIVGDGKQSIYRWRNGNVEQFVRLPHLTHADDWRQRLFSEAFREGFLNTNRRSARAIVEFNNEMYDALAPLLGSLSAVYRHQRQEPHRELDGYVKVQYIPDKGKSNQEAAVLPEIGQAIREALEDGYALGDIAIISRLNKESSLIASWLLQQGYPVVTRESFLLSQSPLVEWIFHWLGWIANPADAISRVGVVLGFQYAFPHLNSPEPTDFLEPGSRRKARTEDFMDITVPGHDAVFRSHSGAQILVNGILHLTGTAFDVYMEFLSDQLINLEKRRDLLLNEVLSWWAESRDKLCIESSGKVNAIQLTTVHKSKGLQYPVVIYPRFYQKEMESRIWVDPGNLIPQIPSALISLRVGSEKYSGIFPEVDREALANLLDDINVCYVATTRAEDRLYILQTKPSMNRAWEFIWLSWLQLNDQSTERTFGLREPANRQSQPSNENPVVIPARIPDIGQPSLRFRPAAPGESDPRWIGSLIHACLANFTPGLVVSESVRSTCRGLSVRKDDLIMELTHVVQAIVNDPACAVLFSSEWKVYPEHEIIGAGGERVRPDRLMKGPDGWMVVDFKTGLAREEHRTQVAGYMNQVMSATGLPCSGFLLYTSDHRLEEVAVAF